MTFFDGKKISKNFWDCNLDKRGSHQMEIKQTTTTIYALFVWYLIFFPLKTKHFIQSISKYGPAYIRKYIKTENIFEEYKQRIALLLIYKYYERIFLNNTIETDSLESYEYVELYGMQSDGNDKDYNWKIPRDLILDQISEPEEKVLNHWFEKEDVAEWEWFSLQELPVKKGFTAINFENVINEKLNDCGYTKNAFEDFITKLK
jgi:hypothetical protein